jgi:hypothetical protein
MSSELVKHLLNDADVASCDQTVSMTTKPKVGSVHAETQAKSAESHVAGYRASDGKKNQKSVLTATAAGSQTSAQAGAARTRSAQLNRTDIRITGRRGPFGC